MIRSTFSTTTIASSTTIPIARIRPRRVIMFSENPKMSMTPKVPINEIGTAMAGTNVALTFCNERNTTRMTNISASNRVLYT